MSLVPKSSDKLLWIDLEMTGLDPVKDRILEVAAIITDWEFNEIATYQAAVYVKPKYIAKRMKISNDFWTAFPEVKESLLKQNEEEGRARIEVEDELLAFISADNKPGLKIILAGNSIHQDRKFIINEWPRLNERLHYRMLDVSAWKVVFEGKYKKQFMKPEVHRAIDDIRGSIEELKYYLNKIK